MKKKDNLVKDISIVDIINERMTFIINDSTCRSEDIRSVSNGELQAYSDMLADIEKCTIQDFLSKYILIARELNQKFENGNFKSESECETFSGYNNAVIRTIGMIQPELEFDLYYFDK